MKNTKKLKGIKLLSILVVVLMLTVYFIPEKATTEVNASSNGNWFTTRGNNIVDQNGNVVWLTGINWFGYNTGTGVFDGVWSVNMEEALQGMADRGFNLLRLPISTQLLYEWKNGIYPEANVNDFVNPELVGMNSLEIFDYAFELCQQVGMKVMVDIHSPHTHAMGHIHPLWYNEEYTTEIYFETLEWLTERFKDNDTLIAIDLANEPHGNPNETELFSKWDDSTDENNWKHAAETAGKKILAINPNLLIVVEGNYVYPKEGYDYTARDTVYGAPSKYHFTWWGGNLRGVKDYPIDLGDGQAQLVYSPHDYGPLVHKQSWFYDGFNKETLYNDVWRDNWAYIHEEEIAPLLIGEWGGFMDGGPNELWMESLRDYMIENRIHHTFWCYNANSGDTGGLVTHDFKTWEEEKYALVKPALWQDSNGKFIGLDQNIPLGANGISLSQHFDGVTPPPTPTPTKSPEIVLGDLNNDGVINTIDLSIMQRYLLEIIDEFPTPHPAKSVADVNGDGLINTADYILMSRYVLNIIDSL